jgi:hypothetical protein
MHFSFGHACYKPHTSYPSWSDHTNKYRMRSIDYEVPYYVIFSFHQLLLLFYVITFPLASYSRTPSICTFPLVRQTDTDTHTKTEQIVGFIYFSLYLNINQFMN